MAKVVVTESLPVSADELWKRVGGIGSLSDWHPGILKSEVSGEGVGAIRTCQLASGATLVERIQEINDAERYYVYAMQESPLPIKNYVATLRVREGEGGGSVIEWSSEFDADGVPEGELIARLETAYRGGLDNLKNCT